MAELSSPGHRLIIQVEPSNQMSSSSIPQAAGDNRRHAESSGVGTGSIRCTCDQDHHNGAMSDITPVEIAVTGNAVSPSSKLYSNSSLDHGYGSYDRNRLYANTHPPPSFMQQNSAFKAELSQRLNNSQSPRQLQHDRVLGGLAVAEPAAATERNVVYTSDWVKAHYEKTNLNIPKSLQQPRQEDAVNEHGGDHSLATPNSNSAGTAQNRSERHGFDELGTELDVGLTVVSTSSDVMPESLDHSNGGSGKRKDRPSGEREINAIRGASGSDMPKNRHLISDRIIEVSPDYQPSPDHNAEVVPNGHPLSDQTPASEKSHLGSPIHSPVAAEESEKEMDRYGFFGGSQYTEDASDSRLTPVKVMRKREVKWRDMIEHWDEFMQTKYNKVRERCRKGIPSSLRATVWQHLCGAHTIQRANPHMFMELVRAKSNPKHIDDIEKDLHRLFPHHELFSERMSQGQKDAYLVLKAYAAYRPESGYCQAQGPIAAVLLMHMPAEEAFWCLVAICDRYLPEYYGPDLSNLVLDGQVLHGLLKKVYPSIHSHLKKFGVDPVLYMCDWFMCIFSRTLPWSSVLRVWDMFFCEGVKVSFRVALVLLHEALGSAAVRRNSQDMHETLVRINKLPTTATNHDVLIPQVLKLKVTKADMIHVHKQCEKKMRKEKEERKKETSASNNNKQ